MTYEFSDYTLDPDRYELTRADAVIPTEPQVFALLLFLIENRDRVVSKEDLIDAIWHGRIVSDATLSSRISAARQAVGDSGSQQSVIRTVSRRGFQFIAPLDVGSENHVVPREPDLAAPSIQYCMTEDGIDLPYAISGQGPRVIKVANWLNHLEHDWKSPMWGPLFQALSSHSSLLRYDSRGVGLSNWDVGEISFATFAKDLESVIEASGSETFALLGISQGAAIAIDYAARHPDRVSHLILWSGFARGRRKRGNPENRAESEAFVTLMRQGWGQETSPFRDMFAGLYLPDGTNEQISWWTELQRTATSPENAVRMREAIDDLDVADKLPEIRTPTLILQSERELVTPVSEARFMAARIRNARFVSLDSSNHFVMSHESAWARAITEVQDFLRT